MHPVESASHAGRVVAGRYRVESKLGQGGMGSVWAAQDLTLGSRVALKLIDPSIAEDEMAAARFVQEARAAAALRSPHVVQILDHGLDGRMPFIAMELLEGESLAERLTRVGRLSPADTARILTEVSRAVSKAHESGIVHRDIKPDNIFLVANDDVEVAKVLDFGIARTARYDAGDAIITQTGAVFGSPYYMSPEQAEGAKDLDHRTDIWSLAVVAYECLLGTLPFDGDALATIFLAICSRPIPVPSEHGPVPPGFDAWFSRGAQRDRNLRFQSVREAALELRSVCEREADLSAVTSVPSSPSEQSPGPALIHGESSSPELGRSFPRSKSGRWWPLAAGLLVIGIGAYAFSSSNQRDVAEKPPVTGAVAEAPSPTQARAAPVEAKPADQPIVVPVPSGVAERKVGTVTRQAPSPTPKRSPAARTSGGLDSVAGRARSNPSAAPSAAERPARRAGSKVDLGL